MYKWLILGLLLVSAVSHLSLQDYEELEKETPELVFETRTE